ncbi:hypothetical protein EW093_00475 [Thiospirochaeta perfilievii]|uniref:Glycosyltransferase n=1 Tax=Thiospirochaeta perfilievii TaxID=252967 RepID=A0A5C1Q8E8_9SPIO|nr:hypothetical protein [Thiospirochaeta perfilievii]QEN03239.1 hypothetical protein EW093_00475 [Thiospirochaeta perfilievii]
MSTIHSTFNRVNTSYTVIGNKKQMEKKESVNTIAALLLSRGGRPYRKELYGELKKLGIHEIISIQVGAKSHFDLEKESSENDELRFLILKDEVSVGEMVNIGISESLSELVLVIWDDMNISSKDISYRLFEKILEEQRICTTPIIKDNKKDVIPTLMTPLFNKEQLKVISLVDNKNSRTLYPYMYVGLYNKTKFIQLGGFDIDLKNNYWQKLDFGLRANMWGESIKVHPSFLIYLNSNGGEIEDITPDKYYRLYSLKNLSIKIKNDIGYLPLKRFFNFYDKSGSSIFDAIKIFLSVRKWVKINKFRFKISAPDLTTNWDEL